MKKTIIGFLNEFAFHNRIAKSISKPTLYGLETTNKCNLACKMCSRQFMKREVGTMSMDLFKKIIDEIKHYQSYLPLVGIGEPLMDEHIIGRINYCEDRGIKVRISTNGTLLDKEYSRKILNSRLSDMVFSMDAITKETYSQIRTNGNFNIVNQNFHNFMRIKNNEFPNSKLRTTVQLITMNANINEAKAFREEWTAEKPSEIFIRPFGVWAGNQEIKKLAKTEYRAEQNKVRQHCYYFWKSVIVRWNGEVVPCCRDYDNRVVLGNMNNQSLSEIWKGNPIKELRKAHLNQDFNNGLCNNCNGYLITPKRFYPFNSEILKQIGRRIEDF